MGRDPRAVITSKHRESPGQYFCNYRVWHECDQAAAVFAAQPRFLRLRYEDLVGDPDAVQRQIETVFPSLSDCTYSASISNSPTLPRHRKGP